MASMLTQVAVERLKAKGKRREVRDHGAANLYLVIQPGSNSKSWAMRFVGPGGRATKLTLGPLDLSGKELEDDPIIGQPLTLVAARRLASQVNQDRARGIDVAARHVAEKKRAASEAPSTFGAVARRFCNEHALRNRTGRRGTARLIGLDSKDGELEVITDSLADRWRDRPLVEIDAGDVYGVINESIKVGVPGLERRKKGASDSQGRALAMALSKMFSWAVEHRLIQTNPTSGTFRPRPSPPRDRVLSEAELTHVWRAAVKAGWPFGTIVQLLVLTGCRLREVAGMKWSELSDDLAVWNIPGARTKNKRPHVVYLPPLARRIIEAVPRIEGRDLLFTTNGVNPVSGFSKFKDNFDDLVEVEAKSKIAPPWRIHDIRRSVATHLVELSIAAPHVVEVLLNHISGHRAGVAGTYNRALHAEERRVALERWAQRVQTLAECEADEKVIPMGRRR
jgi:integrase